MPETRERRIFISDIHMNSDASVAGGNGTYAYGWQSSAEAGALASFLGQLDLPRQVPQVKELVLLGDVLDNWVCPVDVPPPDFASILAARCNAPVVEALGKLCAGDAVRVSYLPGNHDMGVPEEVVSAALPGIVFCRSAADDAVFCAGRVRAEHGHAHAMFNARDLLDGTDHHPLGYYISRMVATQAHRTGKSMDVLGYLKHAFRMLGPGRLATVIFDAVLEDAQLKQSDSVFIPGGRTVALGAVRERFKDLYERWVDQRGQPAALGAVLAEVNLLDGIADGLCAQGGTNVVIFGHSHEVAFDRDEYLGIDRLYANSGAWCNGKPLTFVETEKSSADGKQYVRVKEWKDGEERLLNQMWAGLPL